MDDAKGPLFFHADLPRGGELAAIDPDRDVHNFVCGEDNWILQTFLRWTRAGYSAELADSLPEAPAVDGEEPRIVVYHAGHRPALTAALRRRPGGSGDLILVAVRGDRHPVYQADFEIVQNRAAATGRAHFVLHWPQPGLVPRDPARGETVRRVCFKGFAKNLDPAFHDPDFRRRLGEEGFELRLDMVGYDEFRTGGAYPDWHDYSDVDAVLAVRPGDPDLHPRKPGSKLYNAWLAGVPALLGEEVGFRELRRSPLDYFEIASPDQALAALCRLRDEAGLFRRMVEHGRRRAAEVDEAVILDSWRRTLASVLETWRGRNAGARMVDHLRRGLRRWLH